MPSSVFALLLGVVLPLSTIAQTAAEIVDSAIENTGGAKWGSLNGYRITAKFDQGGVYFPLEIVQLKDGRQYSRIDFEGMEIKQGVFDGDILWSTNFQTQLPQKADQETIANLKLDRNDFPDDLYQYRQKGYSAELAGKSTINQQQCFRIKLIKEPLTIKGVKVDDVVFYYFNTDTFMPVAKEFEMKHGPIQGSTMVILLDDFRPVNGLLFPFSLKQGVKDAPPQPILVESIELNPQIANDEFSFPE